MCVYDGKNQEEEEEKEEGEGLSDLMIHIDDF